MKKKLSIFLIFILSFFFFSSISHGAGKTYSLYYSNEQAMDVQRVKTSLSFTTSTNDKLYVLLFNQLKEPSKLPNLYPAVPTFVQIVHTTLEKNGTLTIDFNDEIAKIGSQSAETVFIKAVNLTYFDNFPEIKHIYYTVHGNILETLSHLDVSEGFKRQSILK